MRSFRKTVAWATVACIDLFAIAWCDVAAAQPAPWQMQQAPLMTSWADDVDPDAPWPEYPRPMMRRDRWLNLNGVYAYDRKAAKLHLNRVKAANESTWVDD